MSICCILRRCPHPLFLYFLWAVRRQLSRKLDLDRSSPPGVARPSQGPDFIGPGRHAANSQPDTIYHAYRKHYPATTPFPRRNRRASLSSRCALSSFTPELAWAAFDALQHCYSEIGWLDQCCSDLLDELGAQDRYQIAPTNYRQLFKIWASNPDHACPTVTTSQERCTDKMIPIYEAFQNRYQAAALTEKHCNPRFLLDRYTLATQSSAFFAERGNQTLKNEGRQSQCCGAGNGLPFFDAELSQSLRQLSIADAQTCGAKTLVTYCTSCALQLAVDQAEVQVTHILDLLLGTHHDYIQLAAQRADFLSSHGRPVAPNAPRR